MRNYSDIIIKSDWKEKSIQSAIFNAAGFKSIYKVLLDKERGPKAGNLIAYMDKDFIKKRFHELKFDKIDFWKNTGISKADYNKWLSENDGKITESKQNIDFDEESKTGVLEISASLNDGKTYMKRILFSNINNEIEICL